MGLLCGENCMILASAVFDWSTRVTDGQTDGQTDGIAIAYARLAYMLSRAKTIHFLCLLLDASLNISTSHLTSTPSTLSVILQLTCYTKYLLTYLWHCQTSAVMDVIRFMSWKWLISSPTFLITQALYLGGTFLVICWGQCASYLWWDKCWCWMWHTASVITKDWFLNDKDLIYKDEDLRQNNKTIAVTQILMTWKWE